MKSKKFKTVDAYLSAFSNDKRKVLDQFRKLIRTSAPDADEVISYNMPAYKLHGMLVYFAGHTEHIGFYPLTSAIRFFSEELKEHETSKGTIKFPYEKKIPVTLIKKIVKFRKNENLQKAKTKELRGRGR
jgi:uncharacterized protein YdhG (YjbR/CyaY superfamily)